MPATIPPRSSVFPHVSRFERIRTLGEGGMGVVYEVYDRARRSRVALKVLRHITPEALLHFKTEFRSLADLQHRNLVALDELAEADGKWFFTMELVRGVQFLDWVFHQDETPASGVVALGAPHPDADGDDGLDDDTAVLGAAPSRATVATPHYELTADPARLRPALQELATALDLLHGRGMVHRDVKPSNVLVTEQGRVVLLDFGLIVRAKDPNDGDDPMGTAVYMAPEQTLPGPVGPESDWYSFGVVLYHALAGAPPYVGTLEEILRAKRSATVPPPLPPDAPEDLAALCRALLEPDPRRRPSGTEVLARLGMAGGGGRREDATPAVFVGREAELEGLENMFAAVERGTSACVLVHGESGVGKSVLVERALERLGRTEHVLLQGRCYEREAVPYKALDEVIDDLARTLRALDESTRDAVIPRDGHLLAQLFRVLDRVPGLTPPDSIEYGPPQERRALAFGALREMLRRLSRRWPLVITVDDLQWADRDSLLLLGEILREPNPPRALFLATVRTTTDDSSLLTLDALREALPVAVHEVPVRPLSPDEARDLASRLAAGGDDTLDLEALAEEAQGHPLWIDALVRHHQGGGGAKGRELRLDDAIRERVQALTPDTRELLELVCVAGAPVAQAVASWATVNDVGTLGRQLGDLKAKNLLRSSSMRGTTVIAPFHDRVREAVVDHLDDGERQRWHGRLAVALETQGATDAEALGAHWAEAGQVRRAARYLEQAAHDAAEALAFDHAAQLYRRSLEHRPAGAQRDDLSTRLADVLVSGGRSAEAAEIYLDVASRAAADAALDLRRLAAEQLIKAGHIDRGMATLREVLGSVGMDIPRTPKRALVQLVFRRAMLKLRGTGHRVRAPSEVPSELARQTDFAWSAAAYLTLVDNIRGVLFQTRHFRLALKTGDPYRLARAFAVEALYGSNAGFHNLPTVARSLDRARELAEQSGRRHAMAFAEGAEGAVAYLTFQWRKAWEFLRDGVAGLRTCEEGTAWEIGVMRNFGLATLAQLGDFATLHELLPAWIREADEHDDLFTGMNLRTGHVTAAWLAFDRPDRAMESTEEAARLMTQGVAFHRYYDLVSRVQIDLYNGEVDRALGQVRAAMPIIDGSLLTRVQHPRMFSRWIHARAVLSTAAARSGTDRKELLAEGRDVARKLEKESAPWGVALSETLRASAEAIEGRHPAAVTLLAQAEERLAALDMPVHAACAARARGLLVGGDEGQAEVRTAEALLTERRVVDADAFGRVLIPPTP